RLRACEGRAEVPAREVRYQQERRLPTAGAIACEPRQAHPEGGRQGTAATGAASTRRVARDRLGPRRRTDSAEVRCPTGARDRGLRKEAAGYGRSGRTAHLQPPPI